MSKQKTRWDGEAGGVTVLDPPRTPTVNELTAPAKPADAVTADQPHTWRFRFRSRWLAPYLLLDAVVGTEADARAELHRQLDAAIQSVECTH